MKYLTDGTLSNTIRMTVKSRLAQFTHPDSLVGLIHRKDKALLLLVAIQTTLPLDAV